MLAFAASAVAFAAVSVRAQMTVPTAPANATALVLSEAQWNASGFDTPLENSQSFGIALHAEALLGVSYGSTGFISNGQALTADEVANRPEIIVYPGNNASAFEAGTNFTLILADASAIGMADPEGDYRHYLVNSLSVPENFTAEQLVFNATGGDVITSYAGPGPLVNTGVHRYAWMLFQQPASFEAPGNLSTAGVAPGHWSVESYVQESNLGDLIAATFFTVVNTENNIATVATSSVNPATLSVPSQASTMSGGPVSSGVPAAGNSNNNAGNTGAASSSFAISSALLVAVAGVVAVVA